MSFWFRVVNESKSQSMWMKRLPSKIFQVDRTKRTANFKISQMSIAYGVYIHRHKLICAIVCLFVLECAAVANARSQAIVICCDLIFLFYILSAFNSLLIRSHLLLSRFDWNDVMVCVSECERLLVLLGPFWCALSLSLTLRVCVRVCWWKFFTISVCWFCFSLSRVLLFFRILFR